MAKPKILQQLNAEISSQVLLKEDPTLAMEATTKQYVDAKETTTKQYVDTKETTIKQYIDNSDQDLYEAINNITVPVTSVNNKTGNINLTAADVGSEPSGTVNTKLNRTTAVNVADTNYSTIMARGIGLSSTSETPTINGTIIFKYG